MLKNAIITGATFEGANLEGAVFEEALIGSEDAKRLCALPWSRLLILDYVQAVCLDVRI